jgi:cell division protein FtsN
VFDAAEQYFQDIRRLYLEVLALVAILAALAVSSLLGVIAVQVWKIASHLEQQDKRKLPTMAAPPQPSRPTPENPYPPR